MWDSGLQRHDQQSGTASPAYVTSLIRDAIKADRLDEEEPDIRESAALLYGGKPLPPTKGRLAYITTLQLVQIQCAILYSLYHLSFRTFFLG